MDRVITIRTRAAIPQLLALDAPDLCRLSYLRQRLAGVWDERWLKAPTKKRPPPPKRQYLKGGHSDDKDKSSR